MTPGTRPQRDPAGTVEVAPCEKNSFPGAPDGKKKCALDGCENVVGPPKRRGGSPKRFCSERCQRIAERRRYRARRIEWATCKGCGAGFERLGGTQRLQEYCSTVCQYRSRSAEYAQRPDILANAARANAISRGEAA